MLVRNWRPREMLRAGMVLGLFAALAVVGFADSSARRSEERSRRWLAGDHHIHSEYSVGQDDHDNDPTTPPLPIIGGDAIYPVAQNASQARLYGLDWMVQTDHGDPHHSKVNRELAYPALLKARKEVPEVLQFYGMEFDTPGADHSSVMIPKTKSEEESLFQIESIYSKNEPWPRESPNPRDTEAKMLEALQFMRAMKAPPIVIAHHVTRSSPCPGPPAPQPCPPGVWGQDRPDEFRNWNDTAPEVAVGFEGAPGHQATSIGPTGNATRNGARGSFGGYPTHGGFDQMTAMVGGVWDSLLGEGRRWWITSTSDSHVNWREGGGDFWPGEYSKTYVKASKTYESVLNGLRNGRAFVTLGDLVTSLDVTATAHNHGDRSDDEPWLWAKKEHRDGHDNGNGAEIGETLKVRGNRDVTITIRLRDPSDANSHGDLPEVRRVDLIVGKVTGPVVDRTMAVNPTTQVVKRFGPSDWHQDGEYLTMRYTLKNVKSDTYIRVRGTNTDQLEPERDPRGEDPWADLWFYSNPIFIDVRGKTWGWWSAMSGHLGID